MEDSINTGVKKFKNYAKSVLPVINNEGVVIGIVTADDVLNTMVLEHEEDIRKMTVLVIMKNHQMPL